MEQPVCICTRLRRATREVMRAYDGALGPSGLNAAQFSLLRAIERAGTPTITSLARDTRLDASTLGRNLRVLERAGLVAFGAGKDRRTRRVTLTQTGAETTALAATHWRAEQDRMEQILGPGGRERLFAMLSALEAR